MKKFAVVFILILIAGCHKKVELVSIPDYSGITLEHYLEDIEDENFKHRIIEEYNSITPKGEIISVSPLVGEEVDLESRITITTSKGPDIIVSNQSNIEWFYVGSEVDKWNFYSPTIDLNKGELLIELNDVVFGTSFDLVDEDDSKSALVTAIIIDPYNKRIPAALEYSGNKTIKKGEVRNFLMRIPITDLDVQQPTSIDTLIGITRNGKYESISVNFSISW